jgi:hypothetical protein
MPSTPGEQRSDHPGVAPEADGRGDLGEPEPQPPGTHHDGEDEPGGGRVGEGTIPAMMAAAPTTARSSLSEVAPEAPAMRW